MPTLPKIYISGFYCGPSPSAGLGIAKSIRSAWPSATIIGIDYWNGSSGLHDDSLSDRLIYPSWDLLDISAHIQTIDSLRQKNLLISALDIEIAWIAREMKPCPNMLIPSARALQFADKPHNRIGEFLPFKQPKIHLDNGDDQSLYDFCRAHSWRIWVKGPHHGAKFVKSWRELTAAREAHGHGPTRQHVFYQSHVRGVEESICFAAVNGKLCGAVHMQKRVVTPDGKTWSGKIGRLSEKQTEIIANAVRKTNWTGGGELELLRDESDQYWLMEFNPRFPAWIYGATLAGFNLPAELVSAATGVPIEKTSKALSSEFTRIVTEVPALKDISLPFISQPEHGDISAVGKYGASYGSLETKVLRDQDDRAISMTDVCRTQKLDANTNRQWMKYIQSDQPTPNRVCLEDVAAESFAFASSLQKLSTNSCEFQVAYSIKTCPDPHFMTMAFQSGLKAEAISMAELERALQWGWKPENIILNGPAKWWPRSMNDHQGLGAVFCDSIEEFERLLISGRKDKLWGLRIKIPGFQSRFGVDLETFQELSRIVAAVKRVPKDIELGFHVHLASNLIGNGHWEDAVQSAISWSNTIASQAGKEISMLDFGGGYHPRDFKQFPWKAILYFTIKSIPGLKSVTIEPGRALSQDTMAMVTRVQDIRRRNGEIIDIVVDTCISELPLARVYPHRIFVVQNEELLQIGAGNSRILGRVCMEDDILAESMGLPTSLNIGDTLVFADAGAYERSMSYEFGYGRSSQSL